MLLDGEEIRLTVKEFELLCYLAEDPGAVCQRSAILRAVWNGNWYHHKNPDAHVAALRKKLGNPRWIEAIRGVGFRLDVPQ